MISVLWLIMGILYRLSDTLSAFHAQNRPSDSTHRLASKVLYQVVEIMEPRTGFVQLISAVVGLSVGVGVMTATVLLGVAALLQ